MGTKNYPHSLLLRLSDDQFESLTQEAKAKGISVSACIRGRLEAPPSEEEPTTEEEPTSDVDMSLVM